jgi:GMP synthase-like glutamine amidotransferase
MNGMKNAPAVLLQHDALYPAGQLGTILRDFGIPTEVRKLYAGDPLPTDLSEARCLILLGGSQRTSDIASSPYLPAEVQLVKQFVDQDRPVVGIGFGAELLSVAGGAKVTELRKPGPTPQDPPGDPTPEFGWFPVNFPFPGGTEPVVFGMVDGAPFFLWHRDTFAMPALPPPANPPPPPARPPTGNVLIASTRACRTQAYKFKNRVFGFQFHFELTQDQIEAIVDTRGKAEGLSADQINAIKADTTKHFPRYQRLGAKLVQNLVQFLKAY